MFGEITDAERTRWQLHAARLLTELLTDAQRSGLPVIRWKVQIGGCELVGVCGTVIEREADTRAAFAAWQERLQLDDVQPERADTYLGTTRVIAVGKVAWPAAPGGRVRMVLTGEWSTEPAETTS